MSSKFKPVDYTRQDAQLLPHESFKSTVVRPRQEQSLTTEGSRTLRLARPAAWTEDTLKCHDRSKWDEFYEAGDVRSMKPKRKAVKLCQGCPAAPALLGGQYDALGPCLREALAQEGDVGAQYRYGVRGGLTPVDRADLASREVPDLGIAELLYAATHCAQGHRVDEPTSTYADGACRKCRANHYQRQRAEGAA